MIHLLTDDVRRNPYPLYAQLRQASPLLHDSQAGLFLVFDYPTVHRVLTDHATFSSRHGPYWLIFSDPPRHTQHRAIISKAFTPRSIVNLESRIAAISMELLDKVIDRGEMDLAADFAVPLPMLVIAEMLGIPAGDRERFKHWNDVLLAMSYTIGQRDERAQTAVNNFMAITAEMSGYLAGLLEQRRDSPTDDLLSRLLHAEIDGQRLSHDEITGFFQLLLLAGSETTTNLINNAILAFIENPDQLALLRQNLDLLPGAIEEVLRYRSPLQWMYRITTRDTELHGQTIPAGKMILAMIGAANHDPKQFPNPERFDIRRDPNPHLAFGHGNHFCLGAPLARLEAKVALTQLLARMHSFDLATHEPWPPRQGMHVLGPSRLPIRFNPDLA